LAAPAATEATTPSVRADTIHRIIKAQVVALDQPFMWNRLGTAMPGGLMYALRSDVIPVTKGAAGHDDQLDAVTPPQPIVIAGQVVTGSDGKPAVQWSKTAPVVHPGDIVQWKVDSGTHGLMFLDFAQAQQALEILPGGLAIGPQPGFDPPAQGTPGSSVQGQLLAQACIKNIPPGITEVPFECTIHKTAMTGKLVLMAQGAQTVTINATFDPNAANTLQWRPASPVVKPGDIVEWRIDNNPANPNVHHGTTFLDFTQAQQALEILPGSLPIGPQPGFNPPAQGTDGTGVQGQLLVRARVKPIPAGMTGVPFQCTVHKAKMPGQLVLASGAVRTATIHATFDPNAPTRLRWDPATPVVEPGDIVEWRIDNNPPNPNVHHGTTFLDFTQAQQALEILPGSLPIGPQPGFNPPAQGTDGTGVQGQLLVRARVKPDPGGVIGVPFQCTVHKAAMSGQLVLKVKNKVVIQGGFDTATGQLRWLPSELAVRPDDLLEWQVDNVPANPNVHHGVTFLDFAQASQVLEILPGGEPIKPQPALGPAAQGTDGFGQEGQVLLRAKVRDVLPPGITGVAYECTIHKARMPGNLTLDVLEPGKVRLRPDKRPRPIVLRADVGDVLEIQFTNLLDPRAINGSGVTRFAGIHLSGMELVGSIASDASWVGKNPGRTGSLAAPGESRIYRYYAKAEGTFLIFNAADDVQGASSPSNMFGMFGAIHVEPFGAEWYRSQVTHRDLHWTGYQVRQPQADEPTVDDPLIKLKKLRQADLPRSQYDDLMDQLRIRFSGTLGDQPDLFQYEKLDPNRRTPIRAKVIIKDGRLYNVTGHPLVNYEAVYPPGAAYSDKISIAAGTPILNMLRVNRGPLIVSQALELRSYKKEIDDLEAGIITPALRDLFQANKVPLSNQASVTSQDGYAWLVVDRGNAYLVEGVSDGKGGAAVDVSQSELELVHSDLTAVISGPNAGRFPYNYESPDFGINPAYPDRRQPYREFTIIYHQSNVAVQAFPQYFNTNTRSAFSSGSDTFAINYGMAGIGSEILANRLGVGPMGNADAVDLKYEEFFLSAWACADPAMVVDVPANAQNQLLVGPDQGFRNARELKFRFAAGPDVIAGLAKGALAQPLLDQFTQHGITLSPDKARITLLGVCADQGPWLVTGPNEPGTPPAPDRKRFVLRATGGDLLVFEGVPNPPVSPAFNSPAKTQPTKAFFPDDPSNVYHSYMRDHTKFRILHAGPGPSHVHHLHAHQWLHSPNSADSHYLDSQLIVPGSSYTLDIAYNGSGNRNQTVGDSIFHCHFYPHFAQGMWSLWRVHDVFEFGTELDDSGRPKPGARALPDGQITLGTPIPAIVPLPTLAMAPIPGRVRLVDLAPWKPGEGQGRRVEVLPDNERQVREGREPIYRNPGYPFFIPGVAGHRAPHPPLDFAWKEDEGKPTPEGPDPIHGLVSLDRDSIRVTPEALKAAPTQRVYLDGGLPRHLILSGKVVREFHTRWDFTKDWILRDPTTGQVTDGGLIAFRLPDDGTLIEKVAMKTHAIRTRPTPLPNGDLGNFVLNGLPPVPGAPYASPGVDDNGNPVGIPRRYKAAVIQTDVVLNKQGWHFPQQRFLSLWGDVAAIFGGSRAPQPLFFRATTGDSIEFWHTNLAPSYYELDDFQVRTPTDVIGQHIHLVKFDVTSSDGAANGFNYEDGTFSPDEVRDRIDAIMLKSGIYPSDERTGFYKKDGQEPLKVKRFSDYYPTKDFGSPPHPQNWDGAQTTVQRWDTDPLLNLKGRDRTLRTVFTHDHMSPSTHQQAGLYAGLLLEPERAQWNLADGTSMNTRSDGGPTSWEGYIVTGDQTDYAVNSYREFALEFQDSQLAYTAASPLSPSNDAFDPRRQPGAGAVFDASQAFDVAVIAGIVQALNTQAKPPAQLSGVVFPAFGIPLSAEAKVTVVEPDVAWELREPDKLADGVPGNPGQTYVLRTVKPGQPKPQGDPAHLFVYTPNIPPGWSSPANAVTAPPAPPNPDPNQANGPPFPQLLTNGNFGTYSLNYRNEPIGARLKDAATPPQNATDLAYVFSSIPRVNPALNVQPAGKVTGFDRKFPPLLSPGMQPLDPYTPLLRAYEHDNVQIRTLVGAFTAPHDFTVQGVRWLSEPADANSGYRNAQKMGISEHFEMLFRLPTTRTTPPNPFADYLYMANGALAGPINGIWGIMRSYDQVQGTPNTPGYLHPLPNNPNGHAPFKIDYQEAFRLTPKNRRRIFNVTAITIAQALSGFKEKPPGLVYNDRTTNVLSDSKAVIFVLSEDLTVNDKTGHLLKELFDPARIQPLILRAAAGDWIQVNLTNAVDPAAPAFSKPREPARPVPSQIGLQPQLVSYDAAVANGLNVGFNPDATVSPGSTRTFYWYAGVLGFGPDGTIQQTPVEFGVTNLGPADTQTQHQHGLYGALIVEPEGSTWVADSRPLPGGLSGVNAASATVTTKENAIFREFVILLQNDVMGQATLGAANYKSEPFTNPLNLNGPQPRGELPSKYPPGIGFGRSLSNAQVEGEPLTPIFQARAGSRVRFRVAFPGGGSLVAFPVWQLNGHVWQEEPFVAGGTALGNNPLSPYRSMQEIVPYEGYNILIPSAGGTHRVPGDYLWGTYLRKADLGTWGLLRVTP
jgi:uncharacterized protein YijF (DUF1287 family)